MEDNCIRFDWAAKRDGRIEGLAEEKAEGLAEGRALERKVLRKKLKAAGMDDKAIEELLS